MATIVFNTAVIDGSSTAYQDRLLYGSKFAVANAAGGAGANVITAVSFPNGELPANGNYSVSIDAGQACFAYATNKTAFGFNVVLQPTSGTTSIAAGTFNVIVEG